MATLPVDDYYALLGVDAAADEEQLRVAWRRLAARWHPDRAGVEATTTFQRLSAAYTVLCDPVARAAYDRRRGTTGGGSAVRPGASAAAKSTATANVSAKASAPVRPAAPGVMLSRLTGQLSLLLSRGAARIDETGFITLVLNESEAAQGGMARITMRVDLWCERCKGSGCAACGGSGRVEELFSAWLAVPPGVGAGEVLKPSAELPGMVEAVRFKVAMREKK
jgi:DnaJ-class molecular chaperone